MKKWIERLQKRWRVRTGGQVLMILLVFILTGYSTLFFHRFVKDMLTTGDETVFLIELMIFLFIVLPGWMVIFVFWATVLNQKDFAIRFLSSKWSLLRKTIFRYKFLWILILSVSAKGSFAQKVKISGVVYDKETKEKLIGAQVYEFHSQQGAVTNEFGYFSLVIPARDSIKLGVSYVGYKTKILLLPLQKEYRLDIRLEPGEQLNEVIVSVRKRPDLAKDIQVSKISLEAKQIEEIPVIMSEPDLIKVIQKLPGVQAGVEGFGGMYVRGGNIDQNLILLDDVPLYYINHLGGFVSVFNTDAINKVTLYKAGFPAKFGDRLSSVLDIRMRDGNKKTYHGSVMLGLLSWKINYEGPIVKDKTSFIVSARRFPYDILMRALSANASLGEESFGYTFYDLNIKINHELSENDQLYLSWYLGDDAISVGTKDRDFRSKGRLGWGNHLAALKWSKISGNRWFLNTTASYTRYRFGVMAKEEDEDYKMQAGYFSGIEDYRIKTETEYRISERLKSESGIGWTHYVFKPGVTKISVEEDGQKNDTVVGQIHFRSDNFHLYSSLNYQPGRFLEVQAGLRFNYYVSDGKNFPSLEPRIGIKMMLGENTSFKLSYMRVQQYVHLLTSGGVGMPVDLWMPATANVPPEQSWQTAGGFYKTFNDGKYEASVEGYYKEINRLITYKPGSSFMSFAFENWEYIVEKNGTGRSFGVELLLRKNKGRLKGWLAYTWAKTYRRFNHINNGNPYPFRFDRRHTLDIAGSFTLKPGKVLSLAWTYGSGYPVTLPVGTVRYTFGNGQFIDYIYTEKNNLRMRAYHRLDISMRFTKKKKRGERTWTLGVYNAYNRMNPLYYDFYRTESGFEIYQVSLFPFLPSFSYSYKW